MKTNLLITTALVAVLSTANVYAETLPDDATNLTSGSYEVSVIDETKNHAGNVSLSGDATLAVNGNLARDEEDVLRGNSIFNINGKTILNENSKLTHSQTNSILDLEIKDNAEASFTNSLFNGDLNVTGGKLNLDGTAANLENLTISDGVVNITSDTTALNGNNIVVSGGEINMNEGTFMHVAQDGKTGKFDISGGTLKLSNDARIESSFMSGSDVDYTKTTADLNISGDATIELVNRSAIAMGSSGNINIKDTSNVSLKDSYISHNGKTGGVNISGGNINIENSLIVKGYDVEHETNPEATHETTSKFNMTGGKLNVNFGNNAIVSLADNTGEVSVSGGEINIANGAELKIYKTDSKTFDNWNLPIAEQDTLKLTDTGAVNLSGKLFANIDGDGSLNFKNSNSLLDGNVKGSNLSFDANHSLSKAISGTIGDLASLNVNGGLLNYDKQTGKITDLSVKDGAGLNIGTKTVNATSVGFADNSSLNFQVSGLDNHGKIIADDITIGTTGTNLNLTLDTGVLAKDKTETFTILDSSNITGAFANLSKNSRYEFVDNGDGTFDITGKATAGDVVNGAGGNANNAGTAAAWDNTMPAQASATAKSVQSALNTLSQTNPQAYVQALTALAPEANGATASTSVEGANQVFGAVGTRLSGGSVSGSKQGMSSGDNALDKGAMWVQGLFNKAKLDKANGFDSDSNGLAFGAEKNVTDDVKLGVGYAYSNTDIDSIGRKTDVDTHTAIAYGEYKPSNWYVNGIATYSWGSYDENKNVAGVGVNADYDVNSFGLQAMTGYDFNTTVATITPEVGMRYVNIKQDGYKDSADQRVGSKTDDVWTAVGGVKVAKDFALENGMTITPEARFALTYDMTQADSASVVTLANGSVYSADASPLKRFGQEVGLGLTADVNDNVELNVGYEGKFRSDYTDHTGMFNAKYKF